MNGRGLERRLAPGELARSSYATLDLYEPGRAPVALDLSDNTNLAGVPPAASRLLAELTRPENAAVITRYPSLWAAELKEAVADYLGVPAASVATGCGSDDVLDSAVRAFSEPGERLAFPDPTFAMLPHLAATNALAPIAVPLTGSGLDVDVDGLLGAHARITYVCTPNNPTGTLAGGDAIDALLARADGLVIVDQAYAEYQGVQDGAPALARRAAVDGRLLVVRTLSKAFGLAGLRVGYAVGTPELVAAVDKSRGPYKIGRLAERVAVLALTEDRAWVQARAREVVEARGRFERELARMGRRPIPSEANFVLVPVEDAAAAGAALRARGIGVRPFRAAPGIGDALRISMAPWSILEPTLPVMTEVLRCAS